MFAVAAAFFLLALLVLVNGVFVAAEFAIVRIRRTRLEELVGRGIPAAKHSLVCVDEMGGMLSTTQIGITVASLGVGWVGESTFRAVLIQSIPGAWDAIWAHAFGTGLAFAVITFVHVVLGELLPKNVALERAEQTMLAIAKPMLVAHRLFAPARWMMTVSANGLLRLFTGEKPKPAPLSEKELTLIMEDSHADGVITKGEAQIIMRAFEFSDRRARDIMVAAGDVDLFALDRPIETNLAAARRSRRARLPLCRTSLDSAFAVVSMKDAWPSLLEAATNAALEAAARPLPEVREDATQDEVLEVLRAGRTQLALVRDVGGHRAVGIVTLEDVLESLHGDVREAPLVRVSQPSQ